VALSVAFFTSVTRTVVLGRTLAKRIEHASGTLTITWGHQNKGRKEQMRKKSVRRTLYLGERLNANIDQMLLSRETDFGTLVRQLLEQELERWQRTNIQLTPKVKPNGGIAGRPMLSAQEKQFREQVRYIDEIYLSLENDFAKSPGVFQSLFGRQVELYREAVAAKDYEAVNWWNENSPWRFKNPPDFENLWSNRANSAPAKEDLTLQ
jgi:hypothetical protein